MTWNDCCAPLLGWSTQRPRHDTSPCTSFLVKVNRSTGVVPGSPSEVAMRIRVHEGQSVSSSLRPRLPFGPAGSGGRSALRRGVDSVPPQRLPTGALVAIIRGVFVTPTDCTVASGLSFAPSRSHAVQFLGD